MRNILKRLNLTKHLSRSKFRITIPFIPISYEFDINNLVNSRNIDERIEKLNGIKQDLQDAIEAVEVLQIEALERKEESNHLQETVEQLKEDKNTAEQLLEIPEESFARLISRASSKSRFRGIIEGSIIGFLTGCVSSLLIWYLTKGH